MRHAVSLSLALAVAVAPLASAWAVPSPDRPAASMRDLQDHFAACFHPPQDAPGSRLTFYFSLTERGQVVARPRAVWFGFKGSSDERQKRLAGFETSFAGCLPLAMSRDLAASVPGKVYFLQYIVAGPGGTTQALLRPFGSHGGGLQPPPNLDAEPVEPMTQAVLPPRPSAPPAWTQRQPHYRVRVFGRDYFFLRPRPVPRIR